MHGLILKDRVEPADASVSIWCFVGAGGSCPRGLSQASECFHVWLCGQRRASETKSQPSPGIVAGKFSQLGLYPGGVRNKTRTERQNCRGLQEVFLGMSSMDG